jgi:hypothetical protein
VLDRAARIPFHLWAGQALAVCQAAEAWQDHIALGRQSLNGQAESE